MSWQKQYSPNLIKILKNRGYKTQQAVEAFLNPDFNKLYDPFQLPDMNKAVKRIKSAIKNKEQIVIYGDYDIDGLSATALLVNALSQMGGTVSSHIPNRFDEGYGVVTSSLKKLKKAGADLIITVDCGSTSLEPLKWAKHSGLDVVVTDHHTVGKELPEAVAVVNPKRTDSKYPFSDLAGVGVAFKLVQALRMDGASSKFKVSHEKWLLDLVALGTVSDVVGLVGENRTLVYWGLKVLSKTPRVGLRALAVVGGIDIKEIDTFHIGFVLGPRMNAAGRLTHAKQSLDLLLSKDRIQAIGIAKELDRLNRQRRTDQDKIMESALEMAEELVDDPVLVLAHPDWSHGIIGIVAAKLLETYGKPTLLLQIMGEEAKGSARSLGNFNMVEALNYCSDLTLKHGGHHFAAGCTIKASNVKKLRKKLNEYYVKNGFKDLALSLELAAEYDTDNLGELTWSLYEDIEKLKPFGNSNEKPVIKVSGVNLVELRPVGATGKHLKLTVAKEDSRMGGIGFSLADKTEAQKGGVVDIWCELDKNHFNGQTSLQLIVKKITPISK
ncbi:MAG: single-stranded-DNA-specific exonuclease RecJ [Candidatus Saccharimonadales bacterium]